MSASALHMCMHAGVCTYAWMFIQACTDIPHTYTHACTETYTHMHIHEHAYAHKYTMEFYSTVKKIKVMSFVRTQMELEIIK